MHVLSNFNPFPARRVALFCSTATDARLSPHAGKTVQARCRRCRSHFRLHRRPWAWLHKTPCAVRRATHVAGGCQLECNPKMHFSKMHFSKMHFSKMHFSKMHFSKMHFSKILQIFGGLVLGCIKTKICNKICVRQHFSSSTRFASFCTAAISKFFAKNRFEKSAIFVKIQQNFCKCRKICKISKISA